MKTSRSLRLANFVLSWTIMAVKADFSLSVRRAEEV
jgi:hypothetical protein